MSTLWLCNVTPYINVTYNIAIRPASFHATLNLVTFRLFNSNALFDPLLKHGCFISSLDHVCNLMMQTRQGQHQVMGTFHQVMGVKYGPNLDLNLSCQPTMCDPDWPFLISPWPVIKRDEKGVPMSVYDSLFWTTFWLSFNVFCFPKWSGEASPNGNMIHVKGSHNCQSDQLVGGPVDKKALLQLKASPPEAFGCGCKWCHVSLGMLAIVLSNECEIAEILLLRSF